ncbi:MAG: hypothetical protein AAFR77_14625 [Cyanobacteria bacterium J06631_2]
MTSDLGVPHFLVHDYLDRQYRFTQKHACDFCAQGWLEIDDVNVKNFV